MSRQHIGFTHIEQDIKDYYTSRRDLEETALSIAVRALSIARELLEPADVATFDAARTAVVAQLGRRQEELFRAVTGGGE